MEGPKKVLHSDEEAKQFYIPFVVNKALSYHRDCIHFSNEMNRYPNISPLQKYDFYYGAIKKYKRKYIPWPKKLETQNKDKIQVIQKAYNVSEKIAYDYLDILSEEQVNLLLKKYNNYGGTKDEK